MDNVKRFIAKRMLFEQHTGLRHIHQDQAHEVRTNLGAARFSRYGATELRWCSCDSDEGKQSRKKRLNESGHRRLFFVAYVVQILKVPEMETNR